MAFLKEVKKFLFGKPEKFKQNSLLEQAQEPLKQQLFQASQNPGAGGAFGTSADYYRNQIGGGQQAQNYYQNNLSDNPADIDAFQRPELRRFNEEIVPDLAEQFAGMGSGGGIGGSNFRNAAINAGTDLSERLASMRANVRQNSAQALNQMGQYGAQGLQNLAQAGLGQFQENIHRPETHGFLGNVAEGAGKGLGAAGMAYLTGGASAIPQFPTGQIGR